MLTHADFMAWLTKQFPNTAPTLLNGVSDFTANGIAPEGASLPAIAAAETLLKHLPITSVLGPATVTVESPPKKQYSLGSASRAKLTNLIPQLRQCVERAITVTTQDFTVLQTARTLAEQKTAVAAGNSRTMKSKHLIQQDGFAHACDLGAWANNEVDWDDFNRYAAIAFAMDMAATQLGIAEHVRWGCSWDRVLSDFGGSQAAYVAEAEAYAKRFRTAHPNKHPLVDAPHFEWVP